MPSKRLGFNEKGEQKWFEGTGAYPEGWFPGDPTAKKESIPEPEKKKSKPKTKEAEAAE